MKEKKTFIWGIRFSKEEVDQINAFRKGMRLNKSDAIRHLIQQAFVAEKKAVFQLSSDVGTLQKELQSIYKMNRYVAGLLTALVRKTSKNNPQDADEMIRAARMEAENVEK